MGQVELTSAEVAAAGAQEAALLRAIVDGTAHSVGQRFLQNLVRHVAEAIGVHHAFASELLPGGRIRTLAYWSNGRLVENIEFDLAGTPCEEVLSSGVCHIPSGVQQKYAPKERALESYIGVALRSQSGAVLGHLCGFDEAPMPSEPRKLSVFQIFAARA